ncbi:MAG: amidohydrolase family protein [Novosphingobium sp.]|nr:amidohydrolase family protein [Novosphingobium sp.]
MTVQFDLVVRGGTIVDGTGAPRYRGDVAVKDGLIAAVGTFEGTGKEELDATGRIVAPGFVDIHTHYDGHATWTDRMLPSSQHGVTTVLAGNCGVGFAPCKEQDRDRLVALMEGVEDIPEPVMTAGLPWNWESFPEYLDSIEGRAFDIDIATQVPHAPLRVFVMGDRAAERDPATAEDIAEMARLARQAIEAGALGFSTSRTINHKAIDGTLTYSYAAASDELAGIAKGVAESGKGVLQFISDFDDLETEFGIVERMVAESGRPLSLSLLQSARHPEGWRDVLGKVEQARADGAPIRAQIAGRPVGLIVGFEFSRHPFLSCPSYQDVAHLDMPERLKELRDPARKARVLAEQAGLEDEASVMLSNRFGGMYEMTDDPDYEPAASDSIAARAEREGKSAVEMAYDVLVDGSGVIYAPAANYLDNSLVPIRTMMAHESTTFGLGDGGAHCSFICDASLPTYYLRRWVAPDGVSNDAEGRMPLETIVRKLTTDTADLVGLGDRGQIKVGLRADLNVIDLDNVMLMKPESIGDLPNGARRLHQRALGYDATIVAGEVTYCKGEPTGALPGRLVRGSRPRAAA